MDQLNHSKDIREMGEHIELQNDINRDDKCIETAATAEIREYIKCLGGAFAEIIKNRSRRDHGPI